MVVVRQIVAQRLVALARQTRLSVTVDNAVVASELDAAMRSTDRPPLASLEDWPGAAEPAPEDASRVIRMPR